VIHRRLVGTLVDGEAFRPLSEQPPPPPADEVVAWRREMSNGALAALRHADLDAPSMTWFGAATARTWLRRMTHELAIHRWDIEAAYLSGTGAAGDGGVHPLDADVGVDSIDELLDRFVPRLDAAVWSTVGAGTSIHAHATDIDGEWLLAIAADGVTVSREHAKGDVAARGTASDLALVFWSRRSPEVLDRFGVTALLDRFLVAATF
jgi:hypothetical protein